MKYIKKFLIISVLVSLYWSCEEDDVCLEGASPNLVVLINDATTEERMTLDTLFVEYWDSDAVIDTLKFYNKDSVQIPLRIDDGAIGLGFMYSLQEGSAKDSLAMSYSSQLQYVSKACGMKKIFTEVAFQAISIDSIQSISAVTQTISNDQEVHLLLYY